GGPFLYTPAEELRRATKAQALRHPNWNMGAKVTIDSASMMNKGFEVIEACHLFGLTPKQVEVLVHPQSAVHSMVQFADGSLKAQLGAPDMRIPIAYALSYPERLKLDVPRFSFTQHPRLTFQQPDTEKFPCLALAYEALRRGGNAPCALNAANEVAVAAFLQDKISFAGIAQTAEHCLQRCHAVPHPSLEDYMETDRSVREIAAAFVENGASPRQNFASLIQNTASPIPNIA
ncbi:MAG: 1-deoxy-D-xylulose-5-phosphate reductoisomerase, partial [Prevotellaceae bacterium]|nr:1-deoxy-D-xylulose-5-phosphate reductoisomerase [Prevotellaceae bacterium]